MGDRGVFVAGLVVGVGDFVVGNAPAGLTFIVSISSHDGREDAELT